MWVADQGDQGVCGFIGLMLDGRAGEVEPVVVTASVRGRGIGGRCWPGSPTRRAGAVCAGSRSRRRCATSAAMRTLHAAGFDTVSTVTLVVPAGRAAGRGPAAAGSTLDLYDLRFRA